MKFCVECGYKLSNDSKFCPKCGKKQPELYDEEVSDVKEDKNEIVQNDEEKVTLSYSNEENKGGVASLVLGILSIVFVLLLITSPIGLIFGIIGLLVSKDGKYKTLNAIGIIIFLVEAILILMIAIILLILLA